MAIFRDSHGLIVQHNRAIPSYQDGGDTACREGLVALVDREDRHLMKLFEIEPGVLTRHPYQDPWNNPLNFSRDQLVPTVAGLWAAGEYEICKRVLIKHFERGFFCQNVEYDYRGTKKKLPDGPDILLPDAIWHLILCAKLWPFYWFGIIGYPFQILSILWNSYIQPKHEQNQAFAMYAVSGLLPLYIKVYGRERFYQNMFDYWGGWRDQIEIASKIVAYTKEKT